MTQSLQTHTERTALVRLAGEVDTTGSERVSDVLQSLLSYGCASSRVDLAGVSYMDTSGLKTVLDWRSQFQDRYCDFKVVSINPVVKRLCEVTGFSEFVSGSAEHSVPLRTERAPITDCAALADNLEIHSFTVSAELRSGKIVRDRVSQLASAMAFTQGEIDEVKLAVGEAMTNAVRHGSHGSPQTITVRCTGTSETLTVEINDPGPGFDPLDPPLNRSGAPIENGMGLTFIKQMVDEVRFDFSHGTTVTLVKHLRRT